jgi:hypothetical protein
MQSTVTHASNHIVLPDSCDRLTAWRWWLIASMLVVVLNCMASAAQASCGNYLYRNGRPVGGHMMLTDSVPASQDRVLTDHIVTDHNEAPAVPCSGPNCTGRPFPVVPIPVAPLNPARGFHPAVILQSSTIAEPECDSRQVPLSERGARFEPSSVFRPPA